MSLIFLGGLNGVGKSTITEKASQNCSLKAVRGSERLMKELGFSAGEYEKLREISTEKKQRTTEKIFVELETKAEDEDLIVSAHYIKVVRGDVTPSRGPWYGHCDKLILVVASPEEILDRINLDENTGKRTQRSLFGSRTAREEKLKLLKQAQELSREVFQEKAEELEVPTLLVRNPEERIKKTTDKVIKFIRRG